MGALALTCALSCATEPANPLVGTFDVTTTLDTFTFETAAPSPPDCPGSTLYCTHSRPANGATLSGSVSVANVTNVNSANGPTLESTNVHGEFTGRFCATIDYQNLTGCMTLGGQQTLEYPSGVLRSSGVLTDISILLDGPIVHTTDPRRVWLTEATFAGDSIAGRVYWALSTGRSPPAYRGTFVARRHR